MEDRSLDEFLDVDGDDEDDPGGADSRDTANSSSEDVAGETDEHSRSDIDDGEQAVERTDDTEDGETSDGDSNDPSASEADVPTERPGTSRYDPAGTECPVCAATVRRLWHDDDSLVCRNCKDWG